MTAVERLSWAFMFAVVTLVACWEIRAPYSPEPTPTLSQFRGAR